VLVQQTDDARACELVASSLRRGTLLLPAFPHMWPCTCARLGWSGTNNLWDLEAQEALGDRCYIVKSPLPFSGEIKNQDGGELRSSRCHVSGP